MTARENKVIKSCAGSGKTHGLIERLAGLLLQGASPGEILAITFTRKAAAEIYERLLQRLRAEQTPQAQNVLRRVMLRETPADDLTINTFHGWFMTLIENRRWTTGAHLPARLRDETQPPLADIVWRQWLKQTETRELSPELQTVLAHISPPALRKLFNEFSNQLNAWRLFDDGGEQQLQLIARARAEKTAAEVSMQQAMGVFAASTIIAGSKTLATARDAARDICEDGVAPEDVKNAFVTAQNEVRKVLEKNSLAEDAAACLLNFLRAVEQVQAAKFNQAALVLFREFAALTEAHKQSEDILTFDDLEYQAWRAVVAENMSAEITARLARKYRHILIDEFQDTSPMQWAVVNKWLLDAHGSDDSPSVYIVGDRKQAIYGFRHGDARLMDEAEKFLVEYYPATKTENKDICRRCAPQVLHVVNRAFDGALPDFIAHKPADANAKLAGMVSFAITAAGESKKKDKRTTPRIRNPLTTPPTQNLKREHWAETIAQAADDAIGKWQIRADNTTRACEARDILILLPRVTHAGLIIASLAKRGIACETSGGEAQLADRFACADLLDLTAVLLFPARDLHLARVLKSPLFSLDDDELQLIAAKRGDKSLWRSLNENTNTNDKLNRAAKLLTQWRNRARNPVLPAADLLHSVVGEGEVFARYRAASPQHIREQVCADIDALLDWSLSADDGNRPLLSQFYQSAQKAPAPAPLQSQNAARLYTVHKAKGLQAPVVILADADFSGDGGKGDSADIFAQWQPGDARPRHFIARARAHKLAFENIADAHNEKTRAEKENLFYVAMTRAQQALMIFAMDAPKEETPAARAWSAMKHFDKDGKEVLTYGAMPPADKNKTAQAAPPAQSDAPNLNITAGKRLPQTPQMIRGRAQHELIALMLLGFDDKEAARITNAAARETTAARKAVNSPQLRALLKDCRAFYVETDIAAGEGKVVRPDLLIVRDDETWVIDYKSGITNPEHHRPQLQTYRQTAASLYPDNPAHAAILSPDGELLILE